MRDSTTAGDLSLERWRPLCPSLRRRRLAADTVVYRQGQRCSTVQVVVRGHIKLSRVDAEGEQNALIILPAGELCGAGLFDEPGRDREAVDTAVTKGPVELDVIPRSEFLSAVASDTALAGFVVDRLARRQAFLAARIEHLLGSDVRRRVAGVLFELAGAYGGHCAHGHEVDVRLTQQELAEMSGARRPTVSTVLNRLRERRIVSYTRRYICIDDLRGLRIISTGASTGPD